MWEVEGGRWEVGGERWEVGGVVRDEFGTQNIQNTQIQKMKNIPEKIFDRENIEGRRYWIWSCTEII